jgi:hypothetical protein
MADLRVRIQDVAQGLIDALGHGYVAGLDLEILSCTDPTGNV